MNYKELVQKHYFHEVDRRRDLEAAFAIPLGVITAVYAVLGTFVGSLTVPLSKWEILLGVAGALGGLAATISTTFIMRSFIGFTYAHPTSMKPLVEWRTKLLADGSTEAEADDKVEELMAEHYAEAADTNCKNNDRKSEFKYQAIRWATISVGCTAFAALPYLTIKIGLAS